MKSIITAIAFAALLGGAHGAVTVGAVNFTGTPTAGNGTPLVNNDGTGLTTSLFFGSFLGGTPDFAGSGASIIGAFTQNGGNRAFLAPGLINGSIGDAATSTDGSDLFTGNEIFVLVGDAATLGASTDVIVFSSGVNWPQEVEGVGAVVPNIGLGFGNLERGVATTSDLSAPFDAFNANADGSITFGVVPEPSVALLGALGVLGLIRRRR